jgi:hypothetical protein
LRDESGEIDLQLKLKRQSIDQLVVVELGSSSYRARALDLGIVGFFVVVACALRPGQNPTVVKEAYLGISISTGTY